MRNIALVTSATNNKTTDIKETFEQLAKRLTDVKKGTKDGAGWIPSTMTTPRRKNENAQEVNYLVLDLEAHAEYVLDEKGKRTKDEFGDDIKRVIGEDPIPLSDMAARIEIGLGWRAVLHSSYSNTAEHPRYRIVLDTTRPMLPHELKPVGLWVVDQLGIADCYDKGALGAAAQFYYLPRCPSDDRLALFECVTTEGDPLDVDSILEQINALPLATQDTSSLASQSDHIPTQQPANQPQKPQNSADNTTRGSVNEMAAIMGALPNTAAVDYDQWLKVVAACHYITRGDMVGYATAFAWSAKNPAHDKDKFDKTWRSFDPNHPQPITMGTLKEMAGKIETLALFGDALDDSDLPSEAPAQGDERNPSKFASIISKTKIGQYATQLADERQMPRDTTVLTALGVVSAAVSMIYSVGYRYASQIPTSLYIATEQPASTGKSGVLDAFTVPIQRAIRDMNRDAAKHNAELAEDDDTPRLPQYRAFVTDATPESLDGLLPRQHGHFCLASAEQGLVNTALGLNYGGGERKSNNDLILKGATGDWHSSLRVTRAGFEGNVFGSVAVIAQRGTIDTILEQSNATGLAERFIMLAEPTLLGHRDHLSKRARADYDLKIDYENATQALIKQYDNARRIGSVEYDWLERLELSGRDWDKIDKIKQQLEPTMADGGKNSHELLRGVVGKFDQRVMKLAAVLHVVESVMAGEKASNIIGSHYVDMAIDLANLSIEQLHTAMIDKGLIGMSAEEEVIYRIISNKGGHGILWNELYNATKGVQPFKSYPSKGMAASIRAVCQAMVTRGLLSAGEVLHGGKSALKLFAQ